MRDGSQAGQRDGLLAGMLATARHAGPEGVDAVVAHAARQLGARDAHVYVVDHEQVRLSPLDPGRRREDAAQQVDATLAGRAYRTLEPREGTADGGVRVWLPLVDGADRLGVLAVDFPASVDAGDMDALWDVALLSAHLLVAKDAYTDDYEWVRRREHATLPAEVQQDLLPPLTAATDDIAIAGTLEPSYAVAGDAFDYAVNADKVHWVVLDAMGHGLEAAMLASVALAAHRYARRRGWDLPRTLATMDEVVAARFGGDRFLTGLVGELERATGRLRVLSAGHHPALLARDGGVIGELSAAPALPVGLNEGASPVEGIDQQLEPGDRVLAYTDGVIEARAPEDGSLFGLSQLREFLDRELSADQPAPEALRRLMRRIMDHQRGELQDDAMLLLLEWFGPGRAGPPEG